MRLFVLYIWDTEYLMCYEPILCIAGFKERRKWIRLYKIESFWEPLTFQMTLLLLQKVFKRDFWEVSAQSKCLQSLGIEPIINLNILYGWQKENLVKFLWNIVEEVRNGCRNLKPGCRNLATKVPNNSKFEIFLGGMLKVHSGVWV